jgi:hypothetical protein
MLLISLLFIACQTNKKERIIHLLEEWIGKEIIFPENIGFTRFGVDTTTMLSLQSEYNILVYIDSTGCTGCKLNLPLWKEFITQIDSTTDKQIPILFFFHPKDVEELHYILLAEGFDYPVCVDTDDALNRLNNFPPEEAFHIFLLDKNNRVTVNGNPVLSPKTRELYLKQIKEK